MGKRKQGTIVDGVLTEAPKKKPQPKTIPTGTIKEFQFNRESGKMELVKPLILGAGKSWTPKERIIHPPTPIVNTMGMGTNHGLAIQMMIPKNLGKMLINSNPTEDEKNMIELFMNDLRDGMNDDRPVLVMDFSEYGMDDKTPSVILVLSFNKMVRDMVREGNDQYLFWSICNCINFLANKEGLPMDSTIKGAQSAFGRAIWWNYNNRDYPTTKGVFVTMDEETAELFQSENAPDEEEKLLGEVRAIINGENRIGVIHLVKDEAKTAVVVTLTLNQMACDGLLERGQNVEGMVINKTMDSVDHVLSHSRK